MISSGTGATCEHCDRELAARVVTLVLDAGVVHRFCSDTCERRWQTAELIRFRRFLRRIWLSTRGRARELANTALNTEAPP